MATDLAREAQIQAGSLRRLSTWMLTNDHDMRCPTDVKDPDDAADLVEAIVRENERLTKALRKVQVWAENMFPRTDCTRLQFREVMAEIATHCAAVLSEQKD